jgi:signal transduction histidine kinase
VGDASHELRTPLSLLKTELDLALRRPRSPAELAAALASAAQETQRLVDLAEDLLLLARSDQTDRRGRGAREGHAIRLAPLLERVTARHRGAFPDAVLTTTCPPDLSVVADHARLERALTNLVSNALEHGDGTVLIDAYDASGQTEIHVRDHGDGFPTTFLPVAFERFTRADQARTGGGSGLGLAIVAAIARDAGGTYGAANRPDGGADVWISLPTAPHPTSTADM